MTKPFIVTVDFPETEARAILAALHHGQIIFGKGPTAAAIRRLEAAVTRADEYRAELEALTTGTEPDNDKTA